MLREPTLKASSELELNEDEKTLYSCSDCVITFGELKGEGTVHVTTHRIVWIKSTETPSSCYSFSSALTSLMVHALCKDALNPYLFLQLENQEDDIQIAHKDYDTLQALYEALCEGQRLNPCEGSSDEEGGGNPMMMGFGAFNNEEADDGEEKDKGTESALSEEQRMELMKEWESKLKLDGAQNLVDNNGYLEPAADGQFDDAQHEESANAKAQGQSKEDNPYLDPNLMKSLNEFAPRQNEQFENQFKTYANDTDTID